MLSVGITEIAERLGLAGPDQAATKSDVGAVDPNGDIVTGVAFGAGVKLPERAKLGAVAGSTQPLAAKVRLCCAANHPCGASWFDNALA